MSNIRSKKVEDSRTILTELIMPGEANPLGNLMGGYLMKWMDIAAGICAAKHSESHVVTASVDHISFKSPIHVGDVITVNARVTRAFGTSMEIYIEVFANDITGKNVRKSNHAYFTFVALNNVTKKPTKVNPLIPLTAEEQQQFESASRRRELRLILSGRLKPEEATDLKSFFKNM